MHPRTSRNTNLDSIWGSWGAPGTSKIDPTSLWMAIFGTHNGEHDSDDDFRCQNCDFGSHFGGPGPLKMRNNGVGKIIMFLSWFFMVRVPFLKGFIIVFSWSFWLRWKTLISRKTLFFLSKITIFQVRSYLKSLQDRLKNWFEKMWGTNRFLEAFGTIFGPPKSWNFVFF